MHNTMTVVFTAIIATLVINCDANIVIDYFLRQ